MAENGILDYQGMNQAIYRGATSNIVVDTQSMSIEIGAGNTSHTSNLHIECDHAANVASIQLNSNVVTEFSRSKKLIKYPRVALTSASYNAYESGYKVTVSGFVNTSNYPWKAFNGIDYEVGMLLSGLNYDTNGNANTSGTTASRLSASDSTPYGEWLKLELPNKIKLDRYAFTSRNDATYWSQSVEAGQVWGSNNDSDWEHLHTFTNSGFTGGSQTASFDVQTENYYKYYAFIVTKTFAAGSDYYLCLPELKYYGIPEYDPDADGVDVTVKSIPNVPNTDWLEVYYDAKGLSNGAVSNPISGLGGTTINGTANGGVTVSDGAFVFDGTNDYISTSITTSMTVHTVSMWIQFDRSGNGWECVYFVGPSSGLDRNNFNLYNNNGYFRLESNGGTNGPYFDFVYNFEIGKWVHLTLVFKGTGLEDCEMYINNERLQPRNVSRSASDDIMITGTNNVYVGSDSGNSFYHDGKIANFRLFNRALSQDEIYQLYAYQKEYFGHGDLSMTFKAGRLGIGTSEPKAALDVKGVISFTEDSFDIRYDSDASWPASAGYPTGSYSGDYEIGSQFMWRTLGSGGGEYFLYHVPRNGILMVNVTMIHRLMQFRSGSNTHAVYWCLRKSTDNGATWNVLTSRLIGHRWINTTAWDQEWHPVTIPFTGRVNEGDQVALFVFVESSGSGSSATGNFQVYDVRMRGVLI